MGIIKRPPGSVAPLHKHDPSTLTEAFTVIDGRLLITDQDGRDVVLDPGDFMYIPERGMHQNKSIHVDETTYAFIENPARGRDASPIDSSSE
jgi:mannose-6-phosphate isomerase-like protein (cupin superfamily)